MEPTHKRQLSSRCYRAEDNAWLRPRNGSVIQEREHFGKGGVEDRLPQTVPPNPGLCESVVDTPISLADVCGSLKPGPRPP